MKLLKKLQVFENATAFVRGICGRKPKILNRFNCLGLSYKFNCIQTHEQISVFEYDFILN